MKKSLLTIVFLLILVFQSCNNDTRTKSPANDTTKVQNSLPTSKDKESTTDYDTTRPAMESFTKIVAAPNLQGNEFYTEKSYQGEKIVIPHWGRADFKPDVGVVIKSVKIQNQFEISFDFGSECNSIENGNFHYLKGPMPDILASYGCDENFSKINEIYLRYNPDSLKASSCFIWEKPYLMGKSAFLTPIYQLNSPTLYKCKDLGFPSGMSLQIGSNSLVNLYSDEYFKHLLLQINTSNGPIDKLYILTDVLTHGEFKSFSIVRLHY